MSVLYVSKTEFVIDSLFDWKPVVIFLVLAVDAVDILKLFVMTRANEF